MNLTSTATPKPPSSSDSATEFFSALTAATAKGVSASETLQVKGKPQTQTAKSQTADAKKKSESSDATAAAEVTPTMPTAKFLESASVTPIALPIPSVDDAPGQTSGQISDDRQVGTAPVGGASSFSSSLAPLSPVVQLSNSTLPVAGAGRHGADEKLNMAAPSATISALPVSNITGQDTATDIVNRNPAVGSTESTVAASFVLPAAKAAAVTDASAHDASVDVAPAVAAQSVGSPVVTPSVVSTPVATPSVLVTPDVSATLGASLSMPAPVAADSVINASLVASPAKSVSAKGGPATTETASSTSAKAAPAPAVAASTAGSSVAASQPVASQTATTPVVIVPTAPASVVTVPAAPASALQAAPSVETASPKVSSTTHAADASATSSTPNPAPMPNTFDPSVLASQQITAVTQSVANSVSLPSLSSIDQLHSTASSATSKIPNTGKASETVKDTSARQVSSVAKGKSASFASNLYNKVSDNDDTETQTTNTSTLSSAVATKTPEVVGSATQSSSEVISALNSAPAQALTPPTQPDTSHQVQPAATQDVSVAPQPTASNASGQVHLDIQATQGVSSAQLIQSMRSSEMKLGMQSAEFGNISINTSLSHQAISAQISIDHSELGKALAMHLPAIEEKLGSAYGVQAKVELRDTSTPSSSNDSGYSNSGQQSREQRQSQGSGSTAASGAMFDRAAARTNFTATPAIANTSRLDIRI